MSSSAPPPTAQPAAASAAVPTVAQPTVSSAPLPKVSSEASAPQVSVPSQQLSAQEVAASAPPAVAAQQQAQTEAAFRAAQQQQAALQQHLQQAMSNGGQGQDLNGLLPPQLQQMLALQQQVLLQQQQQQQRQRQAQPVSNGNAAGNPVSGDDWAAEPLFGGAMEMELPMRFHDISKFRPVPDHQEVFADAHQDQSLVMEILEMAKVENESCAHYFFEDLAVQNDAESSALETVYSLSSSEVPNLPPDSVCSCALGYQTITKGRQAQDTSNYVQIILGVVRLPQVQSDIVISLNTPAYIHEKSSSAEHAGAGAKTAYIRAPELFNRMLQSFKILDMGLFGSS